MEDRTVSYWAARWNVSTYRARKILAEKVATGEMRRRESIEIRPSKTHGYGWKLRPVRVVEFY
jgi:hypothetical protein